MPSPFTQFHDQYRLNLKLSQMTKSSERRCACVRRISVLKKATRVFVRLDTSVLAGCARALHQPTVSSWPPSCPAGPSALLLLALGWAGVSRSWSCRRAPRVCNSFGIGTSSSAADCSWPSSSGSESLLNPSGIISGAAFYGIERAQTWQHKLGTKSSFFVPKMALWFARKIEVRTLDCSSLFMS